MRVRLYSLCLLFSFLILSFFYFPTVIYIVATVLSHFLLLLLSYLFSSDSFLYIFSSASFLFRYFCLSYLYYYYYYL